MKRKIFHRIKKYIKSNSKGAISLFLAVIMAPFLTLAVLIVETGRYNSAISILDEAMGISSTSLLANYDTYLKDRWGVLALNQKIDINNKYEEYLDINTKVLGDSLNIDNNNTVGNYPLSDSEILYNQVMEYSKINSVVKLGSEVLDIDFIIKELEKLKNIGKIFDTITNGTKAIDATINLVDSAEKLKEIASELEKLEKEYENNFILFREKVQDVVDFCAVIVPPDLVQWKNVNMQALINESNLAQNKYSDTMDNIVKKLGEYETGYDKCIKNIKDIAVYVTDTVNSANKAKTETLKTQKEFDESQKNLKELKENGIEKNDPEYVTEKQKFDKAEEKLAGLKAQESLLNGENQGYNAVVNEWNNCTSNINKNSISFVKQRFIDNKKVVDDFDVNTVTSFTPPLSENVYHYANYANCVSTEDIEEFLKSVKEETVGGSFSALINGFSSFFNSLFKMQTFYNGGLSANIDTSFYNNELGGFPGKESDQGVLAIIRSIGGIISSATQLSQNLVSLKLISALKEIKKLIETFIEFFKTIGDFFYGIYKNIEELIKNGYDRILYTTYDTYNLPCRTDYKTSSTSFKNMTGYGVPESAFATGNNVNNLPVIGGLTALIDEIEVAIKGSGSDLSFRGAELEYMLFGSNSEIGNQLYVFIVLYMLRLGLDIVPVLQNGEVKAMAEASTFAAPAVITAIALIQPLAEVIMLVSGGEIRIWNNTIYLTPSGLPEFVKGVTDLGIITNDDKNDLKDGLVNAFGTTVDGYDYQKTLYDYQNTHPETQQSNNDSKKDDNKIKENLKKYGNGLISFNYREYCFMLMLLTVTKEEQMSRLQNLIQMESLSYYKSTDESFKFKLSETYTFVQTESKVSIKQMLPSLLDSSIFTVERKQYRGY